jgi:outer membrane cobalamin receptor
MTHTYARRLFVACAMLLLGLPAAAAAQHENHGVGAGVAQPVVTGTVLCAEGPPLVGAIVQVVHGTGADRHVMATVLTDADGRFALRTAPGAYTLEVSYLGHAPHDRQLTVGAAGTPVNVGTVRLVPAALQHDAIAVEAERERLQLRSGATVLDVRASTGAAGSVADVLRTVPGVDVDADGRIVIRGSASVLVLMNGRRIPLKDDALIAFLKQMPASALERVEASTSASARQDADGMAGVVNLVFRADAANHTDMRSVAASIGDENHYLASVAGSGSAGTSLSWNAAYSWSAMRPRTVSDTWREGLLADAGARSEQDSDARASHRLHSVMAGGAWHLDAEKSLGARGSWSWMRGAFRNSTDFRNLTAAGGTESSTTFSVLEHTIPAGEAAVTFDWSPRGPRHAQLSAEARSSFVRQDFDGDYRNAADLFLTTAMASRQAEHVLQGDLSFDAASLRLELGQKLQLRGITSDYSATRHHDGEAHAFRYDDTVLGAYVSAHRAVQGVQVQAGLRAEAERTTLDLDGRTTTARLRLFPALLLQWPQRDGDVRYRASYSRRIQRPDASMLNPYSMGEDDMNDVIGNPLLRPEVADQFEIGVERHGATTMAQLTPFVRFTRDPIRPLKAVTGSGLATTSLQNLHRTRAAGTDASVRAQVGVATATLSGSVYHMLTEGLAYRSNGVYATARVNLDVRLADRTTLQLYGYRRGTQVVEQGEILPMTTMEVALTQRLGTADRGRLTLRISDPLEGDRVAFRISEPDFVQWSSRRVSRPVASLFFSWAVGGEPREDTTRTVERPPQIF